MFATRRRAEAENPAILETSEPVSSTAPHDVTVNDSLQQSFIGKYLVGIENWLTNTKRLMIST
jgi:hypothetical protein